MELLLELPPLFLLCFPHRLQDLQGVHEDASSSASIFECILSDDDDGADSLEAFLGVVHDDLRRNGVEDLLDECERLPAHPVGFEPVHLFSITYFAPTPDFFDAVEVGAGDDVPDEDDVHPLAVLLHLFNFVVAGIVQEDGDGALFALLVEAAEEREEGLLAVGFCFQGLVVDEAAFDAGGAADGDESVCTIAPVPFQCFPLLCPLRPFPALAAEEALVDAEEFSALIDGAEYVLFQGLQLLGLYVGSLQLCSTKAGLWQLLRDAEAPVDVPQIPRPHRRSEALGELQSSLRQAHPHLSDQRLLRGEDLQLGLREEEILRGPASAPAQPLYSILAAGNPGPGDPVDGASALSEMGGDLHHRCPFSEVCGNISERRMWGDDDGALSRICFS